MTRLRLKRISSCRWILGRKRGFIACLLFISLGIMGGCFDDGDIARFSGGGLIDIDFTAETAQIREINLEDGQQWGGTVKGAFQTSLKILVNRHFTTQKDSGDTSMIGRFGTP